MAVVTGAGLAALIVAGSLGGVGLAAIASSIAAGTVYSAGPRLKRFPGVGLLVNHAIFVPLLFAAARAPAHLGILAPVFALLLTQNQLLHEEADLAEDEAAGTRTTARWLGPFGVRLALAALAGGVAVAALAAETLAGAAVCVVGSLATAAIGLARRPATRRRQVHRSLAATVGVALFLAEVGARR
jgi:4-hydroxybenzoate polyprenyltransferase